MLGGTGFIGSHIVEEFRAVGATVVVLARNPPDIKRSLTDNVDYLQGDAHDPSILSRAMTDVDHVVHALGGQSPVEAEGDAGAALVNAARLAVSLAGELTRRPEVSLTYLSSGGAVYGNVAGLPVAESRACSPISAYGIAKLTAEHYLSMHADVHSLPIRILRVANAYGPGQTAKRGQGLIATLLDAAAASSPVSVYGDGTSLRDYVYVGDVAKAVVRLSRQRGSQPRIVNVGSGIGHSVLDVLQVVDEITGKTTKVNWRAARGFDVQGIFLDVARLRSLTPWAPVSLRDGVADAWAYRNALSADLQNASA
ncbi:MAG: NAD-dependent epimerase/dehydratase [Pseudonocardiales bacterium]|nr:NAD-dependent epimerase/dehydratase [Pseudonocardiales bacterium]